MNTTVKSTIAKEALEAHMEINTKGFNKKQQTAWDNKLGELQAASDQEEENNALLDSQSQDSETPDSKEEPKNEAPKEETKIEAKTTETKEKEKGVEIKILSANYGRGTITMDITSQLNALPNGGNKRKLTNKLAGKDPLPKKVKQLKIVYTVNGEQRETELMENEIIELDLSIPTPTATVETPKEETPIQEEIKEEVTA